MVVLNGSVFALKLAVLVIGIAVWLARLRADSGGIPVVTGKTSAKYYVADVTAQILCSLNRRVTDGLSKARKLPCVPSAIKLSHLKV